MQGEARPREVATGALKFVVAYAPGGEQSERRRDRLARHLDVDAIGIFGPRRD
jgi:hypothetical protein